MSQNNLKKHDKNTINRNLKAKYCYPLVVTSFYGLLYSSLKILQINYYPTFLLLLKLPYHVQHIVLSRRKILITVIKHNVPKYELIGAINQ